MSQKLFSDDQLRRNELDRVKSWLRWKLGGYRVAISDILGGNQAFRGVIAPERPNVVSRISYPPTQYVTHLGRANRIGLSLFYCSVAAPACFYELRAEAGQHIALSKWTVKEPLWMHNLGFHPMALRRLGVEDNYRARFARPIPNETKANEKLRRQLSLAFTTAIRDGEEHLYKLSIAIFENLFDKADPLPMPPGGSRFNRPAGAVYPAMQLHGAADNLVLFPQFVDEALKLESIQYVLVERVEPHVSGFTILTLATANTFRDGNIEWMELSEPEVDRRTQIKLENGHWIMRDGRGREYFRR